jgi:hypothetical protein
MTIEVDSDGKNTSVTVTEEVPRHNELSFSRRLGSDRVFVTIGPHGAPRAVVELTPGMVSGIVQALIGKEMHLTVAMIERIRADALVKLARGEEARS